MNWTDFYFCLWFPIDNKCYRIVRLVVGFGCVCLCGGPNAPVTIWANLSIDVWSLANLDLQQSTIFRWCTMEPSHTHTHVILIISSTFITWTRQGIEHKQNLNIAALVFRTGKWYFDLLFTMIIIILFIQQRTGILHKEWLCINTRRMIRKCFSGDPNARWIFNSP